MAAVFWQKEIDQIENEIKDIKVIKRSEGRVSGFLPEFMSYPSVFFKIYFKDYGYKFERQGLTTAISLPEIEGIRAPHIIQIIPQHKAFILEKRTWQDTDSELKRFFLKFLKYNWRKIGAWLRNFHESQKSTDVNDNFLEWKLNKTHHHIQTLQSLFSIDEIKKMESLIQSARDYLASGLSEWVLSHGDFLIGNIKLSENGMDVIDFEDCQMAPREFDIVNFLTRLEYADYFPNKKGTYQKIQQQFLEGYGLDVKTDSPLYSFLYLYVKLDTLETYFRRKNFPQTPIYQKLVFSYFEWKGMLRLRNWLNQI